MSIVDIIIIIFLIFGALLGLKRGFTRQLVAFVGMFAIVILSFILKNPVSVILYKNLPFFNFSLLKDLTILNIFLYECIAFLVLLFVFTIIFRILLTITKAFEKLLNMTIILGIPSKILGAILGVIQNLIIVFLFMYILNLPLFSTNLVSNTKIGNGILNNTPILTNICNKYLDSINEILELKDEYNNTNNTDEFNQKALNIMIDKKIITKENAKSLIESGKIKNVSID